MFAKFATYEARSFEYFKNGRKCDVFLTIFSGAYIQDVRFFAWHRFFVGFLFSPIKKSQKSRSFAIFGYLCLMGLNNRLKLRKQKELTFVYEFFFSRAVLNSLRLIDFEKLVRYHKN